MSRTPKQRFIGDITALLSAVSVTPQPGRTLVSQALHDALREIEAEVNRGRTNWRLVTALTGVKSYICGARPEDETEHHFWEVRSVDEGRDVYGGLDGLHFRAAMRANVMPSGMTMFVGTADGIGKLSGEVDTSASPTSPTLRLIAQERARIEARAAEVPTEPAAD